MTSQPPHYDFLDPPENEDEIGRLGPYRVTGLLGKGGMGHVFMAEDSRLKRIVALKVMNERFAATPNSRQRFVEEARSMAAIHHDNVATIFEVGIRKGTPVMAMEMLKGNTLEAYLADGREFSAEETLRLAQEVAAGLSAAHDSGIIHRDIKPANIWIESPSGRAKILDFGLALAGDGVDRFSRLGSVVGTPRYLAPEQARNEPVDERTDLYSLGVVLYQMCAGELPLSSDTLSGQLIAIIAHRPKPLREIRSDVPDPLARLIDRLLSKEPRDRPHSAVTLQQLAGDAAERCRRHVAPEIVTTTSDAVQPKPKKENPAGALRKHRSTLIGVALLVVVLGTLGWKFLRPNRTASRVASTTERVKQPTRPTPTVVAPESLSSLQLSPVVAASEPVENGDAARFQMRIENLAADSKSDPRRVNAKATVAAQIVTFLTDKRGSKRKAPVFPKRISPAQLPRPGESTKIEILLMTGKLSPGDFQVSFELQSPDGTTIHSAQSQLAVTENLGVGDLLGFQRLRTHRGGADTHVDSQSSEGLGGKKILKLHNKGAGDKAFKQHVYLRFDLSKSRVTKEDIDRAVLLLTIDQGGHSSRSTITAYGVVDGLADAWSETGPDQLTWKNAPSSRGVESLRYLSRVTIDNGGDALEDVVDGVRIYGPNLDDFLRTAPKSSVTIVLIRDTQAEKPTCFRSKEGNPEQAPALALRGR